MASVKTLAVSAMAILVTAIMFPLAMQQVITTAATGWNAAVLVCWQVLLPVLVVVSIAIKFIPSGKGE
jgi:hypothetical protein